VAFCKKGYSPKAILPLDMKPWNKLVDLGDRENIGDLPWLIKEETLFELDIFDSKAAENVLRMVECSSDETGGLHRLVIMVNSGYQIRLFTSSQFILMVFI
jgi:hypothetical protein